MKATLKSKAILAMMSEDTMIDVVTLPNVTPVRQGVLAMDFPDCGWSGFEAVEGEAVIDNGKGWDGFTLVNIHIGLVEGEDLRIPMEILLGIVLKAGKAKADFLQGPAGEEYSDDLIRVAIKDGWQIKCKDGKIMLRLI